MGSAPSLTAIRRRAPLIALVLLCLAASGVVCSCAKDHPVQAVERALSAVAHAPAEPAAAGIVWALVLLLGAGSLVVAASAARPRSRSPVELRRLLL